MHDDFARRHIGPGEEDIRQMLSFLGLDSLDELVERALPEGIRTETSLDLPPPLGEQEVLERLGQIASMNQIHRSYLGMGYHDTHLPPVLLRNVLENPGWYTAYTPYQAEIAQGRLEALLVYQQVIQELTGLPVANASLLDEGTAAAEAMAVCLRMSRSKVRTFFVAEQCHPQTIEVVRTRAEAWGVQVVVADQTRFDFDSPLFGALLAYPATDGALHDLAAACEAVHRQKALAVVATDLLALTLLRPPGEWGADLVVGNSQRFGVPMGYGGPHAAFMAVQSRCVRKMPGRIIGVSRDANGHPALRMALQTREQHIRREKATSNVCTAQVLLAVLAGLYAVWHGPDGLRHIARRVHGQARALAAALEAAGYQVGAAPFFDTVRVDVNDRLPAVVAEARSRRINLRELDDHTLVVALDETVRRADLEDLLQVFGCPGEVVVDEGLAVPEGFARTSSFLEHPTFRRHRSETEMLRYLHRLQSRDLALDTAMIPLGSCTMKLNATVEMIPITWEGFGRVHPFAPPAQVQGYQQLIEELSSWLAEITGFDAVSMQPNAGSQGEFAGLMVIRAYHHHRGEAHRDVCLIPRSAHGTNPASAVLAGMEVVVVACDEDGNIDIDDLAAKAEAHADRLAAMMVTYPSTHGVFEEGIERACDLVHQRGGQVYLDGANLNAMVGLCKPGQVGADVIHLNLHKTFAIPHGGGGPGMGPIGVGAHLAPFLPGHPVVPCGGEHAMGPVSSAPYGSPSILPISWAYVAAMGGDGLTRATQVAILAANYVARRLADHFPVLYTGPGGLVAHECILECRQFKASAGIEVDDIAKRLMDYGFHAPTMSFPVAGTLMIEPTESESLFELERFCEAMIAIREEIRAIEEGRADRLDNPLKHAPHPAYAVVADRWEHPYSREQAAYPTEWTRHFKYWVPVARVDNVWGDKNLRTALPD